MALKNKKNYCLFLFEIIACMFVVFVHAEFPGMFGVILKDIGRFAVPFFFSVSGYFLYKEGISKDDIRKKLSRRIIRISILALVSGLTYFILNICIHYDDLGNYFRFTFNSENVICLVLFNRPLLSEHNWFLLALLASYIFIYIFPKLFLNKNFLYVFVFLAVFVYIFELVHSRWNPETIYGIRLTNIVLYRNWYFTGISYISIGILLSMSKDRLNKVPLSVAIVGLLVSFALKICEGYIIFKYLDVQMPFFIFDGLLVFFIYVLAIKKPDIFSNCPFLNIRGNWTMYVYVFHPAFTLIYKDAIRRNYWPSEPPVALNWLLPIAVLIVSVAFALFINWLINLVNDKIKERGNRSFIIDYIFYIK